MKILNNMLLCRVVHLVMSACKIQCMEQNRKILSVNIYYKENGAMVIWGPCVWRTHPHRERKREREKSRKCHVFHVVKLSGVEVEDYRQPWIISLQKRLDRTLMKRKTTQKNVHNLTIQNNKKLGRLYHPQPPCFPSPYSHTFCHNLSFALWQNPRW